MERNVTLDFVRGVAILGSAIKHQRLWATKGGLSQSACTVLLRGCMDLGI